MIAFLAMALAMGCVAPAPVPADTPVPFLARQLDVKIDPKEAASYLLNPSPLGKGGYSLGMIVTIDILPKQGWQVDKWIGPVFNVDGTTAKIAMDSSQSIAVRLKPTSRGAMPTNTPTDTLIPPTPAPTATPRPTNKPFPTATLRPTYTPLPTYTPFPTLTPTPRPTPTPKDTSADALFHLNEGIDAFNNRDIALASILFSRAIELGSDKAYAWRGHCRSFFNFHNMAVDDFTEAIRLEPDNAVSHANRGDAHFKEGNGWQMPSSLEDYDLALNDYTRAIELSPDYAEVYNNRSRLYAKVGQAAYANADKAKACSLDSKYC